MKIETKYRKTAITLLRIVIPAGLLVIIFLNVDLKTLAGVLLNADLKYFLISVLFANIAQVIGGATRWYSLVRNENRDVGVLKYISMYWIAMFYGYFLPSNVGMDIYRIAAAGKRRKNYELHVITIVGEKFYTLIFSMVVLFVSYIAVFRLIQGSEVAYAVNMVAVVFIVIALLFISLAIFFHKQFNSILTFLKNKVCHYLRAISAKISSKLNFSYEKLMEKLPEMVRTGFFMKSLVFTVLLKLSLTAGGYFLFLSLGIILPFWYLLFANSVFFVLFLLPVSFGSLGVREGSYIVVYGLFGVSAEAALAASFLALAGLVFTVMTGGIISITKNFKKINTGHGE